MPQRALLDGQPVFAFDVAADAWLAQRGFSRDDRLVMPCCGVRAVPKTSPRGLRFYAHEARHSCGPGAFVSHEHEVLKAAAALAARAAGWEATTEHAEGAWHADVVATRGTVRVAFEIRLTRQSLWRSLEHQQILRAAGVRGAWFFRRFPTAYFPSKALPAFELPAADLDAQQRALGSLVGRLLDGRLRFVAPGLERRVPLQLAGEDFICPGCEAAWFATPVVLERHDAFAGGTARARWFAEPDVRLLRPHRDRTGRRLGRYDPHRARVGCPACRQPYEGAVTPELALRSWPDTRPDGHLVIRGGFYTPGWGEEPPPLKAGPILPLGTEDDWRRWLADARERLTTRVRTATRVEREEEERALLVEMRLKLVRDVAHRRMPDAAIERWLSSPLPGVGDSPAELARRDSDAVRKVEVALGLRDPVTNRPLCPEPDGD